MERLSRRRSAVGFATAGLLLLPTGAGRSHAQAGRAASGAVLTATLGPRAAEWKRAFNPFRDDTGARWPAAAGVYEPLIVYNRATGAYMPWLATGYEWRAGNKTLRFTLRPGVEWSDGTAFTSRDVVFTFELMRRVPALDRFGVWEFLAKVTAPVPATVEFTFTEPYTPGLAYLGGQPIVPEHRWKNVARPEAFDDPSPVGTGPFTEVRRFEPTVYELGRNRRYWQKGKPLVEVLRVPLYRTNEEVLASLQEGSLDWASLFLKDVESRWVAKDPARHLYWYPDLGPTVLLHLNTQRKPFDQREVRKAVSLALDRQRILRDALDGYAPPADVTGLAESQKRWKDPALAQGCWTRRDVTEAGRLLDAAGLSRGPGGVRAVPGGGPLRYELRVVEGWTDWIAAARIIAQNLAEAGLDVTVKALGYHEWYEALERGQFDMGLWFGERGPTPYQFYRGQMDPTMVRPVGDKATGNFHRFGSEEAGRLLRRFEVSSDPAELAQLGRELQRVYVEEAPALPLYASPLWGVFNASRFGGFPSRFNPYAGAAPGQADSLPVLVDVAPR